MTPSVYLATGGRYNPNTNEWITVSISGSPSRRADHSAVWTGFEMIVWGGAGDIAPGFFNTGGRYDPTRNTWSSMLIIGAPAPRTLHTSVWTGSEIIVWGGYGNDGSPINTGGRYHLVLEAWFTTSTSSTPPLYERSFHTAVWTGDEMIVWGGWNGTFQMAAGRRYNPITNTWTPTAYTDGVTPFPRSSHTAVWTGVEMIVWGGISDGVDVNTGGRYNPLTDTWIVTSTVDAPSARSLHTAVWTGSEMIVWGGEGLTGRFNTGGQYDVDTDTWVATPTSAVPAARASHTAVWTGSEMIVWGGQIGPGAYTNTGGRYTPPR